METSPQPSVTPEKAFENLPLLEEARLYRILKDRGVEYIPWRGREAELEAAYVPWETISHEEAFELNGKLEDDELLREAVASYDKDNQDRPASGFKVGRSQDEATREALARYRASTVAEEGPLGKDAFVSLPQERDTVVQDEKPGLFKKLLKK